MPMEVRRWLGPFPRQPRWSGRGSVQMGGDRGGWSRWDLLDNHGRRSADRMVPEWQSMEMGQHLYTAPDGPSRFLVVDMDPNRTLVLRGDYTKNIDGIWGFHLGPAPETAPGWSCAHGTAVGRDRSCGWSPSCIPNRSTSSCKHASFGISALGSARKRPIAGLAMGGKERERLQEHEHPGADR